MAKNKTIVKQDGEERLFDSLKEACYILGLNKNTIANYMSRNKTNIYYHKGIEIRVIK